MTKEIHGKRGTVRLKEYHGWENAVNQQQKQKGMGRKKTNPEEQRPSSCSNSVKEMENFGICLPLAEQWVAPPKFGWLASIWHTPGWQVYKSIWKRLREGKSRKRWLFPWKTSFANPTPLTFRASFKKITTEGRTAIQGKDQLRREAQNYYFW